MEKTVKYKDGNIKVQFENKHLSRDFDSIDSKSNTNMFIINGKEYKVTSTSIRGKSGKFSSTYNFDGKGFPDNEKKVIEYILEKHGI